MRFLGCLRKGGCDLTHYTDEKDIGVGQTRRRMSSPNAAASLAFKWLMISRITFTAVSGRTTREPSFECREFRCSDLSAATDTRARFGALCSFVQKADTLCGGYVKILFHLCRLRTSVADLVTERLRCGTSSSTFDVADERARRWDMGSRPHLRRDGFLLSSHS
jgi:hypothetical protein